MSADLLRDAGNKAFLSGSYEQAIEIYTQCITQEASGDCLCLALSNRAQAYLKIEDPNLALEDATAALRIAPRHVKSIHRKTAALIKLRRHVEAVTFAAAALDGKWDATDYKRVQTTLAEAQKALASEGNLSAVSIPANDMHADPKNEWFPQALQDRWIYVPAANGPTTNLLILLHGLGDGPGNYAKLAKRMALPHTASLALAGPLRLEEDGHLGAMWFRSLDDVWEPLPEAKVARNCAVCQKVLAELLMALHVQGGWAFSHLHLFGFSQGGSAALSLANSLCLGSCVSVSGCFIGEALIGESSHATPMLITRGDSDEIFTAPQLDRTMTILRNAGHAIKSHSVAGKGHCMVNTEPEMRALMTFLAAHLKAPGPQEATGNADIVEISARS